MRRSSWLLVSGAAVLVLGGCIGDPGPDAEQKRGALSSYQLAHSITIPAYFAQDGTATPDFQRIAYWGEDDGSGDPIPVAYTIVNAGRDWNGDDAGDPNTSDHLVHGGPGFRDSPSIPSSYVQGQVTYLANNGTISFGYVSLYYQRTTQQIEDDINAWIGNYGVEGIFFDEAARDDSKNEGGIGRARFFANYARQQFTAAGRAGKNVMFNYGGIDDYLEGFIYCTRMDSPTWPGVYYVTAETDQTDYLFNQDLIATYNAVAPWLDTYWLGRFLHIIYSEDAAESQLTNIMTTSAQRNAAQVYITDLPNPNDPTDPTNPYKYLDGHNSTPQFKLFDDQAVQSETVQTYPYPGSDFWYDEAPQTWVNPYGNGGACPNPTDAEGGVGT